MPSGAQEEGALRSKRGALKRSALREARDLVVALNVTVYDISPMLPISRQLAANYKVARLEG